jgi:hypothetical protein
VDKSLSDMNDRRGPTAPGQTANSAGSAAFPDLPRMIDIQGVATPEAPTDAVAAGVPADILVDLALKSTYTVPQCTTDWVSQLMRLPMPMVEGLLQQLKTEQMLQV